MKLTSIASVLLLFANIAKHQTPPPDNFLDGQVGTPIFGIGSTESEVRAALGMPVSAVNRVWVWVTDYPNDGITHVVDTVTFDTNGQVVSFELGSDLAIQTMQEKDTK